MVQRYCYLKICITSLLLMFFLAGCDGQALLMQFQQQLVNAQQQELVDSRQAGNQLLVVGRDGNLYTMDPDGRNKIALTQDASASQQYLQPTWSPAADQIAWVEMKSASGSTASRIHLADFNGVNDTIWDVPFAPFYMYWSPSGDQLAYLSNWMDGSRPSMALRLVDVLGDPKADESITTFAQGQPFYFSWSPTGEEILTHIGNERLEVQSLDGEGAVLSSESGTFPSPRWSTSNDELFYAISQDGTQYLIGTDLDGEVIHEVTDYDNRITFILSPDGQQLAYVPTDSGAPGMAALGSLYIMDLESGGTREVTDGFVLAFFWSPDSQKVAYLNVELSPNGEMQLRWNVWDGEENTAYDITMPSRTFLTNYLSYFDQYAQSMTLWSPDSTAFTYAGSNGRGQRGIWVQELGEDKDAKLIYNGVYATWSPR